MKTKSVRFILKTIIYQTIILFTLAMTGVACGNSDNPIQKADNSGSGDGPGDDTNTGVGTDDPMNSDDLGICSSLEFKGVTWSPELSQDDRVAFAIALNVSGSFEGHSGWSNLSNNFDGQGVSMGLLNQDF
ncbi:MAG: hypothetical protein MJK18_13215, partial [Bdellovibrionales bacterium]|nr:hypothetical protein [Bdellovibrionales bacterium]